MKITVIKPKGTKETVTRVELVKVVEDIARGEYVNEVHRLREVYPLIHPKKEADGRMRREYKMKLELPRICFAMEMQQLKGERKALAYNGLLVLEANNLSDYDEAIQIRDAAARLPQTMLAFLGASGRSVKILCRGELFPDATAASQGKEGEACLPTNEEEIKRAKSLGMEMIVEGVETKEQAEFLKSHGCTEMQGFFFHKPMSAEDYEKLS